jgi:hypothetical protein
LPDAATQALVMGLIALQLRHHWRLAGLSDTLRHVTVIEEAHRLLRSVAETAANSARNRATEDLANMLAELRAFGAGLIIVDQMPSELVPSVIANTGTKLLHRLDLSVDRELAGRAAGIRAEHVDLLGALSLGDAILRTDRRPRPFRLRMPNASITYGPQPIPDLPEVEDDPPKRCSVCGVSDCAAAFEGANQFKLAARIAKLSALTRTPSGDSIELIGRWAAHELLQSGMNSASANSRLCFLIALGEVANLPARTLEHFRSAFGT